MNIACISHYSPVSKNKSNAWLLDFYSSVENLKNIENVYFFHISYRNQRNVDVKKVRLNNKITDISINIPVEYKLLRKLNLTDKKFISILNEIIIDFLEQDKTHFDIVHVNTLYYAFIIDAFKEYFSYSKFFLHLHENKHLLSSILNKQKYSSVKFLGKYDYIIRQTPINVDIVKKYNSNIIYLPNAFDDSYFEFSEKCGSNKNITILSIGYLNKTKNYKLGLDLVRYLINKGHDVKYNIIGSGPELKKLVKYTNKIGIDDAVTFLGYQNREVIQTQLENTDLLLNTSYFESFGNVFLEAITTGTPIVTCAKGGPEYLFEWSKNRVYIGEFSEEDVRNLHKAFLKVVTNEKGIKSMKNTSEVVCKRFSSQRFLCDLIEVAKNGDKNVNEWWK